MDAAISSYSLSLLLPHLKYKKVVFYFFVLSIGYDYIYYCTKFEAPGPRDQRITFWKDVGFFSPHHLATSPRIPPQIFSGCHR